MALRYDEAKRESGAVTVRSVLAANAAGNFADGTYLAPVLEVTKGLIGIARTAAHVREDILGLIEHCIAISRCIVEAGARGNLPQEIRDTLGDLQADMEAVARIAQRFSSSGCRCWRLVHNPHDQGALHDLRGKLRDELKRILVALTVAIANPGAPPAKSEARIRGDVPKLPSTYVRRTLDDSVVEDLVDPGRPSSSCHCVWGMGGGGKSLLASSVSHDERTLSSFKQGIFWVTVGNAATEDKVVILLERLAMLFGRASTGRIPRLPDYSRGADDIVHHLRKARGDGRALVVLDDVWHEDVVTHFASTGFHMLVTTRRHNVVSPKWQGTFTEVRHMADEEALELLRQASHAAGPLPQLEAISVSSGDLS